MPPDRTRALRQPDGSARGRDPASSSAAAEAAAARASIDFGRLARDIKTWGRELGFQQVGITRPDLGEAEARLRQWLAEGCHGEMAYMARHGAKRARPAELVPGTVSVICVRMDYRPPEPRRPEELLDHPEIGYVARYALGRDYHALLRRRLQRLADRITGAVGPFGYRAFADSAPVLEKPLARSAGLGWIGKHMNLINARAGFHPRRHRAAQPAGRACGAGRASRGSAPARDDRRDRRGPAGSSRSGRLPERGCGARVLTPPAGTRNLS